MYRRSLVPPYGELLHQHAEVVLGVSKTPRAYPESVSRYYKRDDRICDLLQAFAVIDDIVMSQDHQDTRKRNALIRIS